jgi:hypothetical protein
MNPSVFAGMNGSDSVCSKHCRRNAFPVFTCRPVLNERATNGILERNERAFDPQGLMCYSTVDKI